MVLTGELIERVQVLYSKGVPKHTPGLADRHIYSKLLSVRQFLIAQQVKKKQKISEGNYTILPCVELIKVPNHECSCLGNLGCDVYRTKYPLPKILTDRQRHLVQFVMTVTNSEKIEEITREGVIYLKGNKYTANKPKYIFEGNHFYFPLPKSPGIVKIKLLAEDPVEAQKYPSYCDEGCDNCEDCRPYYEYDFQIDSDLVEPLLAMAKGELLDEFTRGKSASQPQQQEQQQQEE